MGRTFRSANCFEDAITTYKKVKLSRYQLHAELAASYAETEDYLEAASMRGNPTFGSHFVSTENYIAGLSYKNSTDRERLRDSLTKAELPE